MVGSYSQWTLHGVEGERLITNIRRETFEKFMGMHAGFFDNPLHIPAILVSRLSIDARRIRDLVDRLGPIAENYFLVAATPLLCYSPAGDWRLSTLALVMSPFCLVPVYLQYIFVFSITEEIDAELVKRSGDLTDYVLNVHTIHAYNLEPVLDSQLQKHLKHVNQLTENRVWRAATSGGLSLFMPCVYQVVVLVCGFLMMLKGQIAFTQMLLVYTMTSTASMTLGMNLAFTPTTKLAQKSANNIIAILDTPSQDDACREVKTEGANGDIVFDKVQFAYPTRPEATILKGVSFTIPKNASVAFVGHSGCGKSTIISLIQRFYKPVAGTISLNGVEVNQLNLDWYRGAILRNPAILLLDEATSALDSENQEKFLEALDGWRKSHPCTVVTVAHRLSTIVDSDIIFMCENGVVVGSGKHEELLKSCAAYADLVRGQMN